AALAGEARPTAARQDRRAEPPADRDRLDDILLRPRDDNADGDLTVVGRVLGVEAFRSVVEAHFALDVLSELGVEAGGVQAGWGPFAPVFVDVLGQPLWTDKGGIRCQHESMILQWACRIPRSDPQKMSRIFSRKSVSPMRVRFGSPRASASAICRA